MSSYRIIPRQHVAAAYISEYFNEGEAFREAMRLAKNEKVNVDVCLRIGGAVVEIKEERVTT